MKTFYSENVNDETLSAGLLVDIQVFKLQAKLCKFLTKRTFFTERGR